MTNGYTDIKNTDMMLIMGGNPAENHPCGFKWAIEAKKTRNAKMIVVDPRFTRTAATADLFLQIRAGAEIFERNCAPCHGPQMRDPESAFDLRKFPHNQHDRFVNSVTRGKNQMPPWGDMLKSDEIEALWAYVTTGER